MPWSKMIDMEMDDEDIIDMATPIPIPGANRPSYPYGLRICLTEKELAKLKISPPDKIGDVLDLRAFGTVTSISSNKGSDGEECCRIEIQLEKIAVESEMQEATKGK